jgi:hypothetical protein
VDYNSVITIVFNLGPFPPHGHGCTGSQTGLVGDTHAVGLASGSARPAWGLQRLARDSGGCCSKATAMAAAHLGAMELRWSGGGLERGCWRREGGEAGHKPGFMPSMAAEEGGHHRAAIASEGVHGGGGYVGEGLGRADCSRCRLRLGLHGVLDLRGQGLVARSPNVGEGKLEGGDDEAGHR